MEGAMHPAIGLIGFGAVGRDVFDLVNDGAAGAATVVGVLVRDPSAHRGAGTRRDVPFVDSAAALLALGPTLVVEAAGHDAMRTHVPAILEAGVEVLGISCGAFADPETLERVRAAAERGGTRLRVPSGAIAALDAISAAAVGPIERVTHTVRKPPIGLLPPDEAAAVVASGQPRELFAGPAREAALRFPANVNVVAAVSLAGIGLDRTEARVVADPGVTRNTHDVVVEGAFGRLTVTIENTPSENPKTGVIVPLSLVRAIRAYGESVVVGG
jgi:aspartate dehydrogenase